ncbi:hypothetical protein [Halomicrobium urmianum]|uniref:hypothetical protein n=1 Tax=Halomicrobium urmianum TaxID=1586233 RepID=UPI001CD96F08|nr:hypothetical protein [Halomicrobium urmianum]
MSTQISDADDSERTRDTSRQPRQTRPRRLLSTAARRTKDGTAASAVGGLLVARAIRRAPQRRLRAGLLALLGGTLVGLGLRQRRSGGSTAGGDSQRGTSGGEGEADHEVSAEAHAHRVATDMTSPDTNPRGTTGEPKAEGVVDREVEDVAFDEDQSEDEVEARPTLGGDDEDPRIPDEETPGTDDDVEVSLSETDMTDELGKVSQPEDEQAFPASEGTDPEPTSPEAPERYGEGAVANPDSDEVEDEELGGGPTDDEVENEGNEADGGDGESTDGEPET